VQAVLSLLDDGATVPFITRYRAANTGGLDEVQVRAVRDALVEQRELARAKLKALAVVDERAPPAARAQLHRAIQAAADRETLKDILAPFGGAGKKSLAEAARVDGLEPLALEVWAGRLNDAELRRLVGAACSRGPRRSSQEVLEGVSYLLAELVVTAASESGGGGGGGGGPSGSQRSRWAERVWQTGFLHTTASRAAAAAAKPKKAGAKPKKKKTAASAAGGSAADTRVVEQRVATGRYSKYIGGGSSAKSKGWSCPLRSVAPHVTLAVNRGESEKVLSVSCQLSQHASAEIERGMVAIATARLGHAGGGGGGGGGGDGNGSVLRCLQEAARDGCARLLLPSLYRAARRRLTEHAATAAAASFGKSLRGVLLAPPYKERVVLGLDPGYRNGCKWAVVAADGRLLESGVIYPNPPQVEVEQSARALLKLAATHAVRSFAVGNGQGHRELCQFLATEVIPTLSTSQQQQQQQDEDEREREEEGAPRNVEVGFSVVSEAGASIYSVSAVAQAELPQLAAAERGAVSIARRLLDPLAELIKLDPTTLGVGMYQKDLKQAALKASCADAVESCVHWAGVDLNTASSTLLQHVGGIGPKTAEAIVQSRESGSGSGSGRSGVGGAFRTRAELLSRKLVRPKLYEQAAGVLRVTGAGAPALDATEVHPSDYPIAEQLLSRAAAGGAAAGAGGHGHGQQQPHGVGLLSLEFGEAAAAARKAALDALLQQMLSQSSSHDTDGADGSGQMVRIPATVGAAGVEVEVERVVQIIGALSRAYLDPREAAPPPVFRRGVLCLADVSVGMELTGTIRNELDFGWFVDCGLGEDGLLHTSAVPPHCPPPSIGEVLTVAVGSVDVSRGRLGLRLMADHAAAAGTSSSAAAGGVAGGSRASHTHHNAPGISSGSTTAQQSSTAEAAAVGSNKRGRDHQGQGDHGVDRPPTAKRFRGGSSGGRGSTARGRGVGVGRAGERRGGGRGRGGGAPAAVRAFSFAAARGRGGSVRSPPRGGSGGQGRGRGRGGGRSRGGGRY
jgi:uncharacterized protein